METITLILPLFVLVLGGYAARKTGFLSDAFVQDANRLVYYVALPVTLFTEMREVGPEDFAHLGLAAGYPLVVVATMLFALLVSVRMPRATRGAFVQVAFRGNLAYFGLPIALTALGAGAAGPLAVVLAVGLIINTVVSIVVLRLLAPDADASTVGSRLLSIVRNPLIIAVAVGLLASFVGLELPGFVATTFRWIASMSLPLILIVLGSSLSFRRLKAGLRVHLLAALAKLVVMPLIALAAAVYLFEMPSQIRSVLVLMSAMPTAVVSQTFAAQFGADAEASAAGVSLSTLLAMVTVPVWLALLL